MFPGAAQRTMPRLPTCYCYCHFLDKFDKFFAMHASSSQSAGLAHFLLVQRAPFLPPCVCASLLCVPTSVPTGLAAGSLCSIRP